jgi:hypothetical protein
VTVLPTGGRLASLVCSLSTGSVRSLPPTSGLPDVGKEQGGGLGWGSPLLCPRSRRAVTILRGRRRADPGFLGGTLQSRAVLRHIHDRQHPLEQDAA